MSNTNQENLATVDSARSPFHTFVFGGGIAGLVSFLAVGLLPSIVYGGFAGVTLAAAILGHPVGGSILARGIVVFGTVVGLLATAAIFVVAGAALAAGLYSAMRALVHREDAQKVDAPHKAV